MASIYKQGQVWWIQWYENGQRFQKSLKTKDKSRAQERKRDLEHRLAHGDAVPAASTARIRPVYDQYLAACRLRLAPATVEVYRHCIGPFITYLGNPVMNSVTPAHFESFLQNRAATRGLSPKTVNHTIRYVKGFFRWAQQHGHIAKSPLLATRPVKEDRRLPRHLSKAEVKAVRKAARGTRAALMVDVALYTGLRLGELKRLTWEDIDLKDGQIVVRRAKSRTFRAVPIHPRLVPALRRAQSEGVVFDTTNLRRIMAEIFRQADVPWAGFHTFRHTFASSLVMAGVPLVTVAAYLGHADIKTTMIYSHLAPDHARDEIKRLAF